MKTNFLFLLITLSAEEWTVEKIADGKTLFVTARETIYRVIQSP